MQLVQALERADQQSDALRKALAARIANGHDDAAAEDILVALARELKSVSTRLTDVADGEDPEHTNGATAPTMTRPDPKTAIATTKNVPTKTVPTKTVAAKTTATKTAPATKTTAAKTVTAEVAPDDGIARLDALDAEADALRAELERALLANGDLRDSAWAETTR